MELSLSLKVGSPMALPRVKVAQVKNTCAIGEEEVH